MRHVIPTFGHRTLVLLALVAVFTVALGAEAQAANRGKVVRYWERQLHTGGTIQLLDYRILRCGPDACIVRWHIRAFFPGDESDLGGFNEYVGDDACYPTVRVPCDTREPTVRWVAAGGDGPASSSVTRPARSWRRPPRGLVATTRLPLVAPVNQKPPATRSRSRIRPT